MAKYQIDIDVNDQELQNSATSAAKLDKSIDNLTQSEKDLSKASTSTSKALDKQDKEQKDLNKTTEKGADATETLADSTDLLGGNLGVVSGILPKVKSGLQLVSRGFKTMRGAIISTGIGALIVVLGSLIEYFTSTGEGAAKLARIMAPFKVLFGNLTDILSDFGGALVSAFENPKQAIADLWEFIKSQFIVRVQSLVKFVQSAGKVIGAAFTLDWDGVKDGVTDMGNAYVDAMTGVEDTVAKATKAVKGFVDETIKESNTAVDLADRREALRKAENEQIVASAELRGKIAEERLKAEDIENNSLEERMIALQNARDAQDELFESERAIIAERTAILEEEQKLNKTSAEGERELAELKVTLIELDKTQADQRRELLGLSKAQTAEAKTGNAAIVKSEEQINIELQKRIALEQQLADIQQQSVLDNLSYSEKLSLLYAKDADQKLTIQQHFLDQSKKARLADLESQISELDTASETYLVEYEQLQLDKLSVEDEYELKSAEIKLSKAKLVEDAKLKEVQDTVDAEELKRAELQKTADFIASKYDEMGQILGSIGLDQLAVFTEMASGFKELTLTTTEDTVKAIGGMASAGLQAAAQVAYMIAGSIDATSREGFEKQKKARQAGAVMDAFGAAIAGMLAGLSVGGPWGIALGAITAAASLAFGLAQADKIGKTQFDGSVPGGGGSDIPTLTASSSLSPNSNVTNPVSPTTDASLKASNEIAPIKAYVIPNEVTTGQAISRNTVANATF